jgi:hypothetical protein
LVSLHENHTITTIKIRVKFDHGVVQRLPFKVQPRAESLPNSRSMLWIKRTSKLPRENLFSLPDHKELSSGKHAGKDRKHPDMLNLAQAGLYIEPSGDGNSDDRPVTQSLGTAAPHV